MTSTIATPAATTTTCPWWCTGPANHRQWAQMTHRRDDGMAEHRFHGRDFDNHVSLVQVEYRDDEGASTFGDAAVYVVDFEDEHMSAAQAREHAANVLAAADLLDRAVAGR